MHAHRGLFNAAGLAQQAGQPLNTASGAPNNMQHMASNRHGMMPGMATGPRSGVLFSPLSPGLHPTPLPAWDGPRHKPSATPSTRHRETWLGVVTAQPLATPRPPSRRHRRHSTDLSAPLCASNPGHCSGFRPVHHHSPRGPISSSSLSVNVGDAARATTVGMPTSVLLKAAFS